MSKNDKTPKIGIYKVTEGTLSHYVDEFSRGDYYREIPEKWLLEKDEIYRFSGKITNRDTAVLQRRFPQPSVPKTIEIKLFNNHLEEVDDSNKE